MAGRRIDLNSIHFKLLIYFSIFALVIIALIGGMEVFLFNNFYGRMKERDTIALARTISRDYTASSSDDTFDVNTFVDEYARQNDVSILIMQERGYGLERITGSSGMGSAFNVITDEIHPALWQIYQELVRGNPSGNDDAYGLRRRSSKMITDDLSEGRNMLAYACYLNEMPDASTEDNAEEHQDDVYYEVLNGRYVLYILAPLYPTTSTVRILRNILLTIMLFAFALVLIIALYLSQRISKPIKDITRSAEELGKGNYDTEFKGGHYSELNELADTLTVAAREMKKTDMYQKDLIANVSHDIRTPLTMIRSYAEMIHDISGNDPEKRAEHIGIIIEETDRLNLLVNDMLNLSRLQSHKLELEKTRFDMALVAGDVISTYDILKEQEGYDIRFTAGKNLFVEADEGKIRQVMNNILTNAVKYCGSDKVIIVDVKKSGKNALFSVEDHGQGIAEDELPHVWDKYYKSSTHHVRETTGTGLGLSIVREILRMHDAEYGVDSKIGEGSTFWFSLPLKK